MYDRVGSPRAAPRQPDSASGQDPGAAARLALGRVRKLLTAYLPGMACDRARLEAALAAPLPEAGLEDERPLAVGWLRWLGGDYGGAEGPLTEAVRRARAAAPADAAGTTALPPLQPQELLARGAYWRARVGLLRGRGEALAEFEGVLRELRGAPEATAWFVDLLWRAGRVDRAGQVWKSVRGNRKVMACDEGPLLEARALLWRGEAGPAERLLQEAAPAGGVAWVERRLLRAWALSAQRQHARALAELAEAGRGPYPAAALAAWRELVEGRAREEIVLEPSGGVPPLLADYVRGQEARRAGRSEEAAAAFREACAHPAVQPVARYALACLGRDDVGAVLALAPGLFLAVRSRARLAAERFRLRHASPAELLDAVRQATAAGFRDPGVAHLERLACALQQGPQDADALRALAAEQPPDTCEGRNLLRAAVELAARGLPPSAARGLLREWDRQGRLDGETGPAVGRRLLRLLLDGPGEPDVAADLARVERLAPGEPLMELARAVCGLPPGEGAGERGAALALWQSARELKEGPPADLEGWRERVRGLGKEARLRPLAQALLLQEAAGRGDASAVAGLLEEADAWRGFRPGPPPFVLRAVEALVAAQPGHPAWRRSLPRWLQLWDVGDLGPAGATLAVLAEVPGARPHAAEALPGVAPAPWFLHQAARALTRDDAVAAWVFASRAVALDPDLSTVPGGEAARAALPGLRRRAQAQALAVCLATGDRPSPAGLYADMVDRLRGLSEGQAALRAAERGDAETVRAVLADLAEAPGLAHHLALVAWRTAEALEDQGQAEAARPEWRRAWRAWLALLAGAEGPPEPSRGALLDWLLGVHRRRVNDLLAAGAVDAARSHWELVQGLPGATPDEALAARVERFRDELATEYLLATREGMRYGDIPEGWRADYEKGLAGLRRLLSLDRDNVRLLTALVEVCGEWFLDLYNAGDPAGLREQVERHTPFALHLARRVEGRPGEGAARAALSEFTKFRGFVAAGRAEKAALYAEALRLNPGNANARGLLAELGDEV